MGSPRNIYRRFDVAPSEPLIGREHSGVYDRERAEIGSNLLLASLTRLGLTPHTTEPRRRTFEEQLALVEAGRATLVEKAPVRSKEYDTLGGVNDWAAL